MTECNEVNMNLKDLEDLATQLFADFQNQFIFARDLHTYDIIGMWIHMCNVQREIDAENDRINILNQNLSGLNVNKNEE